MRLTRLYIDGFGLFHNLKIEGLSPELTVFLGMNESGKSTLLGFLRAILFGFPDRRSNENLYPPLAGGQHGGNVALVTDDQHLYVVERYPGPRGGKVDVLKPDQTRGGKEFLNRLLGMANRTLFRNIYAFSLSELQTFETLDTESVREAIYSAGAGINPSGLARLKSGLEKKESELYKPGGSKPRINAIVSRLNALSKEKKALSASIEEYDRIRASISGLKEEIHDFEERRLELSIQLKKTEQWINIWPEWINLSLTKQKLEELEVIDHFPSQGLSRFETLKTRLEDLQNELLKKEEDFRRQESELSALKIDPDILNHAPSIRQLQRDQGHFDAVVQELLSIQQQLSIGEQRLKESLNNLGPTWTEEKILEFDLSIAAREEVRHYREILQQAKLEEQRKRESLGHMISRKNEAEEVIRNLPEPTVKEPERLSQMKKSCGELRRLESEVRLLREELGNIDDHLGDLTEEKGSLEENLRLGIYGFPLWLIFIMTGTGLLFLIWFGFHTERSWAVQVGGLLLLCGLLLWFLKSKLERRDIAREQSVKQRVRHLTGKMDDLETKRMHLNTHLDRIKDRMVASCSTLSISEVPSREDLERMEEELAERIKQLDRWMNATEELLQAKKKHEEGELELQHAESESGKIQDRWQNWLKDRELNPVLTPDGALETLSFIESFREQMGHLNQLRAKIASLEKTKENFLDLANQVLKGCNRKLVGDDDIQGVVHSLIQEFLEIEKAEQKKALLVNEMKVSRDSMERIRRQTLKLQEEMYDLMASGGTDDEEQFRKKALIYENRMALKVDTGRYEDSIKRLSNNLGPTDRVMKKLSKLSLEELEGRKIRLERELKEAESDLDRLKKEEATLEEQARQLVNDDRISSLRTEEEGLKEELSFLAAEWCTVRIGQGLIRKARARYQKERQPEVIREAGRFFNQLTLGRYPSLVAPIGENRIEVMCQDHSRKEIGELSRGTAEQLYLSLRFGFIREFSKTSESLPIIMDEILVNFDPQRVRATAKAILELSHEHQILFFTCHPRMASLFREIDPHIPVLEISDQGAKRWEDSGQ